MVHDFCIVGGGIVGLSTALSLQKARPGASVVLLEKEAALARHQTGHNSGVIHAGVYYAPGSLKARLCREGMAATKEFCTEHNIAFDTCGKLIVATRPEELPRMEALLERATANAVAIERIGAEELKRREPNITGVDALFASETGIVDYRQVCEAMARQVKLGGGAIVLSAEVTAISEHPGKVEIVASGIAYQAHRLVVCGGLQSDRLARLAGFDADFRIVPFRGEYYELPPEKSCIVSHLIYPVPAPDMPFLGIHLTRMIDGSVTVGPNAVLGLAREGYPRLSVHPRDAAELLTYPGLWRLIRSNWRHTLGELKGSLSRAAYLEECRRYCPSLKLSDLGPREAGIRAQAVTSKGEALHDFLFAQSDRILLVCNAPSPAATSAIPIGRMIAQRCLGEMKAA